VRIRFLVAVLLVPSWACRPPAETAPGPNWQQVPVLIELRLAASAPSPGLTPAAVYGEPDTVYLHSKVELANEHVARIEPLELPDGLVLQVWLTGEGAQRLWKVTAGHIGDSLAILINSVVISVPIIQEALTPHFERPSQLTVPLQAAQAKQLANAVSKTWPIRDYTRP
jgi:hypothetical protein